MLPARIFRNPKIIVEISQNWDPNPKVSQTESQGTSQGFIKTQKNNNVHLAAIQVQVWDNIYNIDAVRRKYSITATKSNKSLTMFT